MIVEADHRAESAFVRVRLKVIQSFSVLRWASQSEIIIMWTKFAEEAGGTQITQQMMEQWGCSSEWKPQRHAVGSNGHFDLQY